MSELLIDRTDFDLYRPLPATLDFSREIEPCIYLAQRGWLRSFLGAALYRDVWSNPTTTANAALISGGTYTDSEGTKDYYGLKPAITLYAYALYLGRSDLKITKAGNRRKKVAESEPADDSMVDGQIAQAMQEAQGYLEETRLFLLANKASYPLAQFNNTAQGSFRLGMVNRQGFWSENNNGYLYE